MKLPLDATKTTCGCSIHIICACPREPFTVTKTQLRQLTKWQLFELYARCVNDEVGYGQHFRGCTKAEILEMFLDENDSVELTPFY